MDLISDFFRSLFVGLAFGIIGAWVVILPFFGILYLIGALS